MFPRDRSPKRGSPAVVICVFFVSAQYRPNSLLRSDATATWAQLWPTRPSLSPTWAHLAPIGPNLRSNMAQLGQKLDPFGSNSGPSWAPHGRNTGTLPAQYDIVKNYVFTGIFHVFWNQRCSKWCVHVGSNLLPSNGSKFSHAGLNLDLHVRSMAARVGVCVHPRDARPLAPCECRWRLSSSELGLWAWGGAELPGFGTDLHEACPAFFNSWWSGPAPIPIAPYPKILLATNMDYAHGASHNTRRQRAQQNFGVFTFSKVKREHFSSIGPPWVLSLPRRKLHVRAHAPIRRGPQQVEELGIKAVPELVAVPVPSPRRVMEPSWQKRGLAKDYPGKSSQTAKDMTEKCTVDSTKPQWWDLCKQDPLVRVLHFTLKFSHKVGLVTCPCAFRLRRLAQSPRS